MDYIYSELDVKLLDIPYGKCFFNIGEFQQTTIAGMTEDNLEESFEINSLGEGGHTVSYTHLNPKFESFAYPKPYGKLKRIVRNGIEDLNNWSEPSVVTKNNTVYYLYNTSTKVTLEGPSEVTFMV